MFMNKISMSYCKSQKALWLDSFITDSAHPVDLWSDSVKCLLKMSGGREGCHSSSLLNLLWQQQLGSCNICCDFPSTWSRLPTIRNKWRISQMVLLFFSQNSCSGFTDPLFTFSGYKNKNKSPLLDLFQSSSLETWWALWFEDNPHCCYRCFMSSLHLQIQSCGGDWLLYQRYVIIKQLWKGSCLHKGSVCAAFSSALQGWQNRKRIGEAPRLSGM